MAKYGGFCFGVKNALKIATESKNGVVLGDLVHNDRVVSDLEKVGVGKTEFPITPKGKRLIIGADSATKDVYLKLSGADYIDATCINVKKSINVARQADREDATLVILGDKDHEEIVNVSSYCKKVVFICDIQNAIDFAFDKNEKYYLIAQTTLPSQYYSLLKEELLKKSNGVNIQIIDTLCKEVSKRIEEATALALRCQTMLVVGDKKSANCRYLYQEVKKINDNTFFVSQKNDVSLNSVIGDVGVTGGASVYPEEIENVAKTIVEEKGAEMVRL